MVLNWGPVLTTVARASLEVQCRTPPCRQFASGVDVQRQAAVSAALPDTEQCWPHQATEQC